MHFPDVEAIYFRSLLDFLYSGQTCVPANDVEHLHDLLDLLQIKPGVWRTGNKDGSKNSPGEKIEVLSRLYAAAAASAAAENNSPPSAVKLDHQPQIDINSNEGNATGVLDGAATQRRKSKSGNSSPSRLSVKQERINESSSCDDERDLDDDIEEEVMLDKKKFIPEHHNIHRGSSRGGGHLEDCCTDDDMQHHRSSVEHEDDDDENEDSRDGSGRKSNEIIPRRDIIGERRRSSSDPVNLSLGLRDRGDDDSNDGHIDVETIGNAPSKVSCSYLFLIHFFFC